MTKQPAYEEALALATTLPLEQLAQLIGVLSELLQKRYETWTALQGVDEVRDYLEWNRFRDSHYADGRRKNPQEFLPLSTARRPARTTPPSTHRPPPGNNRRRPDPRAPACSAEDS